MKNLKQSLARLGLCMKSVLTAVAVAAIYVLVASGDLGSSSNVWLIGSYVTALVYFLGFCALVFGVHFEEFFVEDRPSTPPLVFVWTVLMTLLLAAGVYITLAMHEAPWVVVPSFLLMACLVIFDVGVMSPRVPFSPNKEWRAVIADAVRLDKVLLIALLLIIVYSSLARRFGHDGDAGSRSYAINLFCAGASAFGMFVSTLFFILGVTESVDEEP